MRKVLICALALSGVAASAQAADLGDSLKDMSIPSLSVAGVTLYGTIDVGYGYAENSTPVSGAMYVGLPLTMWGNKAGWRPISTLDENMLEQSKVGLKIEENVGAGFVAIGKLETNFNPLSGEIADACQSIVRNQFLPLKSQDTNGDGSRCGQAFGGQAWGGVSNATYGTLTVGRQYSLENDQLGKYDPMGQSYALSILGFTATTTAGAGATELSRWDNSVKYVYTYGPAHVAGMYSGGGQDTGIFGQAWGANAGVTYMGFSVDGVFQREDGEASLSNNVNFGFTKDGITGTVTDGELWSVMGKYTYDFGGGFKDEGPASKITFFGGYAHVEKTNHGGLISINEPTIGGYTPNVGVGGTVPGTGAPFWNTTPYKPGQSQVYQTEWGGAKYEMGPWAFAAAYYHVSQDGFNGPCTTSAANGPANPQASNCAGDFNQASILIDYTFTKNFDVYAGASWSDIHGGLASDFLKNENAGVISGVRVKF